MPQAHVARQMDLSRGTVAKWWHRWLAEGEAGLVDRSSRSNCSPRRTDAKVEERICGSEGSSGGPVAVRPVRPRGPLAGLAVEEFLVGAAVRGAHPADVGKSFNGVIEGTHSRCSPVMVLIPITICHSNNSVKSQVSSHKTSLAASPRTRRDVPAARRGGRCLCQPPRAGMYRSRDSQPMDLGRVRWLGPLRGVAAWVVPRGRTQRGQRAHLDGIAAHVMFMT